MNEQELLALQASEEYIEAKKAWDEAMSQTFTAEQIEKQKREVFGAVSLPTDREFKFVKATHVVNEENPQMNHVVLHTEDGHSISVGRILEIGLIGSDMEDPQFKVTPNLDDMLLLNNAKQVSPEVHNYMHREGLTKYNLGFELIQREVKLRAKKVKVKTYFPTPGAEKYGEEAQRILNSESLTYRNSLCKIRDSFVITVVK